MRIATKAVLSIPLGLMCLAAVNCGATAEQPAAVAAPPADPGVALVEQVARAYQEAPAIVDDFEITMRARGAHRTDPSSVRLGPGTDGRIEMEGFTMTAADGQFTIEHEAHPAKYLQVPLHGDLLQSFAVLAGGNSLPIPHAVLRYGTSTQDYLNAFGLARSPDLRIITAGTSERDGETYEQLTLANGQGVDVTVLVDPETKFVRMIEWSSMAAEITATMSPKRVDRLPDPLAVATEGRRRVDNIGSLVNLAAGDDAPDFTLQTLDGKTISLADQRGSLAVLDFWATWCGPCKMGLPKLQEFETWAKKEGLPVTVLPVNMGERQRTQEAKREAVSRYWKTAGFTMPTLMDYDNTAARAFQVGSIPHTVVVDPEGKIVKVEVGFNRNAVAQLKELTRRTFGG